MTRVVSLDLEARPYANPAQVRIQLSGNPCRVPSCGYLAGDAYICPSCVEAWECDLGNVAAMVEDLEVAQRKQARFGEGGRGSQTDPPMPADLTAGYWLHRLRGELVGQIRLICESGHIRVPELDTTVAMSRWLLRQSARIAYLPEQDGWGLVNDLAQMMSDCTRAIDAPARRKYVRVCEDCGLSVWARDEKARCECGREYDADAEYEARMEDARDYLLTLAEAATLARVPLGTVRSWANLKRGGRLEVKGCKDGAQLVRFGDVADMATQVHDKRRATPSA